MKINFSSQSNSESRTVLDASAYSSLHGLQLGLNGEAEAHLQEPLCPDSSSFHFENCLGLLKTSTSLYCWESRHSSLTGMYFISDSKYT